MSLSLRAIDLNKKQIQKGRQQYTKSAKTERVMTKKSRRGIKQRDKEQPMFCYHNY